VINVGGLLIEILKSGTLAFLGNKITKSLQQKEISEIIAGCGWCIVGIDVVKLIMPIINGTGKFFDSASRFFSACDKFAQTIQNFF
jgi:hypothetical protein